MEIKTAGELLTTSARARVVHAWRTAKNVWVGGYTFGVLISHETNCFEQNADDPEEKMYITYLK